MATATETLTLAEYAALPDDGGPPRELDEGRLVRMTFPKTLHSRAAMRIARLLWFPSNVTVSARF